MKIYSPKSLKPECFNKNKFKDDSFILKNSKVISEKIRNDNINKKKIVEDSSQLKPISRFLNFIKMKFYLRMKTIFDEEETLRTRMNSSFQNEI